MTALAETLLESGYEAVEVLGRSFVRIAGLVAPYNEWEPIGSFAESFAPGVFTESLARQPDVPLLSFHSRDQPALGLAVAWQEEPFGLYGVFRIAMTAAAQMASSYVGDGLMNGMSVGFVPLTNRWSYAGTYNPEAGMSGMDKVVRVKARLAEVSLVNAGAYASARVTSVESEPADPGANRALALAVRQPAIPNYVPPASNHQQPTFEPAPDDTAVTVAPDVPDPETASSLAELVGQLVEYVAWIANRLSVVEGVAGGAVVTTSTPDAAGGGVAGPVEAVVP